MGKMKEETADGMKGKVHTMSYGFGPDCDVNIIAVDAEALIAFYEEAESEHGHKVLMTVTVPLSCLAQAADVELTAMGTFLRRRARGIVRLADEIDGIAGGGEQEAEGGDQDAEVKVE